MSPTLSDAAFLDATADRLAAPPAVRAVALGGSRAEGTARPDSDWDLAVYYRGAFDPADLRAVGWPGVVSELGGWGGGVFNGGAWLEIEARGVDVHTATSTSSTVCSRRRRGGSSRSRRSSSISPGS